MELGSLKSRAVFTSDAAGKSVEVVEAHGGAGETLQGAQGG